MTLSLNPQSTCRGEDAGGEVAFSLEKLKSEITILGDLSSMEMLKMTVSALHFIIPSWLLSKHK